MAKRWVDPYKVKPVGDRVVIKIRKTEEISEGGIYLSAAAVVPLTIADVISVGTKVIDGVVTDEPIDSFVVGDVVVYDKFVGVALDDEKEFVVMRCEDLVAKYDIEKKA